jgi:hypothetical protein
MIKEVPSPFLERVLVKEVPETLGETQTLRI